MFISDPARTDDPVLEELLALTLPGETWLDIGAGAGRFALPIARRVWRAFGEPKPAESPVPNPVWPLWFAPHAFILTRRAGGLLVLGMILGVIIGH